VTGFRSFNNSTGKRVLNLLAAGNMRLRKVVVERITVIECEVNDGGCYLMTQYAPYVTLYVRPPSH